MAKIRSPNYPQLDLGAALELMRPAWKAEHRNKMSRLVLAKHMGYKSLNGRALGRIGAVRAYGFIEGSSDELRISDDAVTVLASPDTINAQYKEALERLAFKPSLFQDIRKQYPDSLPSETNLSFWLVQQGFTQDAGGKAAKSFLSTMRLVYEGERPYNPPSDEEGQESMQNQTLDPSLHSGKPGVVPPLKPGMLQEVFNLEEGPVTLTFPAALSGESYNDLADHIALFLRKASRRSGGYYVESYDPKGTRAEKHWNVSEGDAAVDLVKEIIGKGKIARVRCPLDADPDTLQELGKLGAQRF